MFVLTYVSGTNSAVNNGIRKPGTEAPPFDKPIRKPAYCAPISRWLTIKVDVERLLPATAIIILTTIKGRCSVFNRTIKRKANEEISNARKKTSMHENNTNISFRLPIDNMVFRTEIVEWYCFSLSVRIPPSIITIVKINQGNAASTPAYNWIDFYFI
jgi:hypothetical protein